MRVIGLELKHMGNNLNTHSNTELPDKWLGYSLTAIGSGMGSSY